MREIFFITSNKDKFKEASSIINSVRLKKKDIDYFEVQDSIERVSELGAKFAYQKIKKPLIVEDSGLFIDFLDGFPGPYSAYVYDKIGNKGILKLLSGIEKREATFKSVISYFDGDIQETFTGSISGRISKYIKGNMGFGYDPIFIVENQDKTFGEMETGEKNKFSHRKKAFKKFDIWANRDLNNCVSNKKP